ncbi:MAG: VWA domain-containing protein [Gemmatimonadales bacterium]|nr:MAG: VWA domain-containing protein [Gemmatimonadales bacterium]
MRFASPWYLLLLAPVAALIWLELRKRTSAVRFSDVSFLRTHRGAGRHLKSGLLAVNSVVLVLMVLALARPQRGRVYEEVESRGVDIMLCMDVSETMTFADYQPSRIAVARQRALDFIAKRRGDRAGLVIFANGAMARCPLTVDKAVLGSIIDRLEGGTLDPTRTAIGMGLASAVGRIKDSRSRDKIVILLTDGLNNTGEIDPLTAAELARSFGIKVYCIGIGSKGPVTVMINDPLWGPRPQTMQVDFDMKTLDEISAITGGKSFLASDNEALKRIYDEIDRMEPTTFKVARHTVYAEQAQVLLLPAALLFLLGLVAAALLMRRLP